MKKRNIALVLVLIITAMVSINLYNSWTPERYGIYCFVEVTDDNFDTVTISIERKMLEGEAAIGIATLTSIDNIAYFNDPIASHIVWGITVYCYVNSTFEITKFEVLYGTTLTDVLIHSSSVHITIGRSVLIFYQVGEESRLIVPVVLLVIMKMMVLLIFLTYECEEKEK